jgi:hypothetical protein
MVVQYFLVLVMIYNFNGSFAEKSKYYKSLKG